MNQKCNERRDREREKEKLAVNKREMKPTKRGECCARAENCLKGAQRIFSWLDSFVGSLARSSVRPFFPQFVVLNSIIRPLARPSSFRIGRCLNTTKAAELALTAKLCQLCYQIFWFAAEC